MDLRWMLRLYPRAWQERYRDEVNAHLEQRRATPATALDLLLGALDAHLAPTYPLARSAAGPVWAPRVRLSNRLVFWAFPVFLAVWSLLRLIDADGPWSPALGVAIIGSVASTVGAVAATASALATIAAGVVLAVARFRAGGPLGRRLGRALPPVLPPLSVVLLFALHAMVLRGQPWWGIPPFVWFWSGALALPLLVGRGVGRDDLTALELRLMTVAATIVAVNMVAQLGVLLVGPVLAGPDWSGSAWSLARLAGFAALLLPAVIAVQATGRGLLAFRTAGGAT
jgi:hypothetical protein